MKVLADGQYPAGTYEAVFETRDLPSGTYFYRIETIFGAATGTMMLAK